MPGHAQEKLEVYSFIHRIAQLCNVCNWLEKKYFSSLIWIVGSPLGIDRSGLHLVDVNYNAQSMPTFYWNWCSCVLKRFTFQMKNWFRQFSFFIPVQNHTCQNLVLIIALMDKGKLLMKLLFVCFGMWCSSDFYVWKGLSMKREAKWMSRLIMD